MVDTSVLEEIGLTNAEKKVYLALIELGLSTTGPIIKRSKLHSSVVYHCLEKLIQDGFVSYVTKGKKKIFHCFRSFKIIRQTKRKRNQVKRTNPLLKYD